MEIPFFHTIEYILNHLGFDSCSVMLEWNMEDGTPRSQVYRIYSGNPNIIGFKIPFPIKEWNYYGKKPKEIQIGEYIYKRMDEDGCKFHSDAIFNQFKRR